MVSRHYHGDQNAIYVRRAKSSALTKHPTTTVDQTVTNSHMKPNPAAKQHQPPELFEVRITKAINAEKSDTRHPPKSVYPPTEASGAEEPDGAPIAESKGHLGRGKLVHYIARPTTTKWSCCVTPYETERRYYESIGDFMNHIKQVHEGLSGTCPLCEEYEMQGVVDARKHWRDEGMKS
ncbi:hypothetical protein EJ08DRAFT_426620 [Tothia fuscella]|uniref:Uncharacterized protein n=1 Tax=Tothia fuscella TaxID=1048955 RepID=A0A9P4NZX0_9PEZI|nr:hypothetical protein EJ08DRAFT_426620 [Tothia fuscella]